MASSISDTAQVAGRSSHDPPRTGAKLLRAIIAVHVFAVALTAALSMADRGVLVSHVSAWAYPVLFTLTYPALSVFVVCPALTILVAITFRCRPNPIFAILAEALLMFAQALAIQPAMT